MKTLFTLLLLSIVAIGRAQTPFPNGDFENWHTTTTGHELPSDANWNNLDSMMASHGYLYSMIFRTTDAYSGSSALMMASFDSGWGRYNAHFYTGLCCTPEGQVFGSLPYHDRPGFLGFYYKYAAEHNDTGHIILRFTDAIEGAVIGSTSIKLEPASTYTKVVLPITYFTPDTANYLLLNIFGSKGTVSLGRSTLLIDSIFFSNDTGTVTAVNEIAPEHSLKLYPNPAADYIEIPEPLQQSAVNSIIIMNTAGQRFVAYNNRNRISIAHLSSGLYILCITDRDGRRYRGKFVKQ